MSTPNEVKSAFLEAYRENKDAAISALVALEIPVSDLLDETFKASSMVCEHLVCTFEILADGVKLSEEEIITLKVPKALRMARYAEKGAMRSYGPGLFPEEGIALLYGAPKVGKTQWILDRLSKWPHQDDGRLLRTVHIALESARSAVLSAYGHVHQQAEAGQKWACLRVLSPSPGAIDLTDPDSITTFAKAMHPWGMPDGMVLSPGMERLRRDLHSPDVLVLDSFSRAIAGQDENSAQVMSAAVEGLQKLRDAMGARLLVVLHHTPKDGASPRGHGALLGGVDCAVRLTTRGSGDKAVTVATCTDARDFEDGRSIRYTREATEWTDLCEPGPTYPYLEFNEMPADLPTTSASKPTSASPDAPAEPAKADAPPTPPKAATGPKLNRTPLAVWSELALVPNDRLALADARERIMGGAVFATVDSRRRAQKLADVLASFVRAGLVVDDHLTCPPLVAEC